MSKLRFAVWLPTYAWADAGPEHVRRLTESIRTCEEHDLDVWVIDHLLAAPGLYGVAWLEPLSVLAYAAALTQKVRLATGILVLPVRHPVVLAKEISTLCHISGGRFVLGIGPGWYSREFDVTGSRIEERGGRTDEILEAVTRLLSRPNASYQGRYYQFQDVTIDPRPPTLPEIWVSGGSRVPDPYEHDVPFISKTVLDRIVKCGNWLSRCSGKQEWVKRDWAEIQKHAGAIGKNPAAITFGHCNFVHLVETNDHARALAESREPYLRVMGTHRSYEHLQECYMIGSIDRIKDRIADLVDAGLRYLVLGPVTDDPGQIDLLARHLLPDFA
ncbi:MAG: LLM class flavin-dependent oxidoreductase [Bacillati bacterium ANGP1]|uniref:LLM class flavin-dependent oxidoreductase n=1 Tax=Candidatus Segetimicrobium genomatis TaxID=2569760 RepID=A0A537K6B5_9BACT|nr:MAG: LLM class flavin-dependent oxidoreductase [Terrabacteria group bacterium ANGP1]